MGSVRARCIDVRFVAATNQDLTAAIAAGRFREDLWFRLNGIELYVAPLRDRRAEILPAARQFLREQALRDQLPPAIITEAAERVLLDHDWPGNFRELRNVVERASVICDDRRIEAADLLLPARTDVDDLDGPASAAPIETERQHIIAVLSKVAGNRNARRPHAGDVAENADHPPGDPRHRPPARAAAGAVRQGQLTDSPAQVRAARR